LHCTGFVTQTAAIMALSLTVLHPPLSLTRDAERINLPAEASQAELVARPFTQEWVLRVPDGAAAAIAARLNGTSRLCPDVSSGPGEVILSCVTARLRATLVRDAGGTAVSLFRLSVPPWRPEDEGPPLVSFDLEELQLGGCPGDTPAVQGECALWAGDRATARARFEEAARAGPSPLAELRLGDLALADDEPEEAMAHWRRARTAPWGRLASARICELEPKCLASESLDAVYDITAVEHALRADMVLRRVRLTAFSGDLVAAARRLSAESQPGGACYPASIWCRHLLLLALRVSSPAGAEALPAYLDLYARREGPLALELVRAAAVQAEREGAPVFAANLLASSTGSIPAGELDAHLLRTTSLYLEGADRARADEIYRYARVHLGDATLRAPRWAALKKELRPPPRPAPPAEGEDPVITAAKAAVEAARLLPPAGDQKP
jgi:hypothetical protein